MLSSRRKNMFDKAVTQLDAVSPRAVLTINTVLAVFVGVALGGALFLTYQQPTEFESTIRIVASITLPSAAILLVTVAAALVHKPLLEPMLALHSVLLFAGAIATVVWVLRIACTGIPQQTTSWSPGFTTALVAYSVFAFRRSWLMSHVEKHFAIKYLHFFTVAALLPLEFIIMVRMIQAKRETFQPF